MVSQGRDGVAKARRAVRGGVHVWFVETKMKIEEAFPDTASGFQSRRSQCARKRGSWSGIHPVRTSSVFAGLDWIRISFCQWLTATRLGTQTGRTHRSASRLSSTGTATRTPPAGLGREDKVLLDFDARPRDDLVADETQKDVPSGWC